MSSIEATRVLFGLDTFWQHLRKLKLLGLLLRTCKPLRKECDLAFAVAAMGRDRIITKAWARRWLGACGHWMTSIPCDDFTLVVALRVVAAHGGLIANGIKATGMRKKEEAVRREKQAERDQKKRERVEEENRKRRERSELLYSLFNAAGLSTTDARYKEILNKQSIVVDDVLVQKFQKERDDEEARKQRKIMLDERMKKEKLPCEGYFYRECLSLDGPEINNATIAELRFRNQIWNNRRYDNIVQELVNDNDGYYTGIHAEAREIFRSRFVVDERGYVRGRRT